MKPSSFAFLGKESVRDLRQNAGAVAGARIGTDRAAMLEIDQDRQRILDDLMRLAAFDIGDEADAAGILVERGIIETRRGRYAGVGGIGKVGGTQCDPLLLVRPVLRSAHFDIFLAKIRFLQFFQNPVFGVPAAFAAPCLRCLRQAGTVLLGAAAASGGLSGTPSGLL